MAYTIVLDAGHGGSNPGATYKRTTGKTDALNLTLASREVSWKMQV